MIKLSNKSKIVCLTALIVGMVPNSAIAEPSHISREMFQPQFEIIQTITAEKHYDLFEKNQIKEEQFDNQQQLKEINEEKKEQREKQEEQERKQILQYFIDKMSTIKSVQNFDLRTPSGLNENEANILLEGTGLEGLGGDFVNAESVHKVNAVYLMAHAAWESGWGTSKIAKTKNNLFGFAAYDNSPGKSAIKFETKGECIMAVAKYISENYLEEQGEHYNGSTLKGMNIKYASDDNWAEGISSVMISLANKTNDLF